MKMGHTLDITMAVPGLPFNGRTFDKQSIGGSESAGYYMARALAKRGHNMTVFCNTEQVNCPDVNYLPLTLYQQYCEFTAHDVTIVQRLPEAFVGPHLARFAALWCHDLALMTQGDKVIGTSWNYDKIFVLSEFMRQQYKDVHGLPDECLFLTRNGVDLSMVAKVRAELAGKTTRNPLTMIYGARPERGLDVMLEQIMPRVLKREPKARLLLATYNNPPTDQLGDFYRQCDAMAERYGRNIMKLGHLTKAALYQVYMGAQVYVYPTPSPFVPAFREVSCISAMEAMACGLPFVSTKNGALPETLAPGAGVLVDEPVNTEGYYDAFADAVIELMRDQAKHAAMSAAGEEHAKTLGWDGVAEAWEALFYAEIAKRSADKATLANHFWRRSDIYAARACLEQVPADDPRVAFVRERIANDFAFVDKPDGFRLQYEAIGATHDDRVVEWSKHEPRYATMRQWLQHNQKDVRKVLDYGCAHGGYAINLLSELPWLHITGVDIDLHGIEMASGFARNLKVEERWRGVVGDHTRLSDPDVPEMHEQYDCVIAQEVIEHVADPAAVIAALEARVRDGGWVYITVPFGPWEYSDYRRYPHRAHLREFDLHDLRDIIELPKKDTVVSIQTMPYGRSPETDDALGWWVIQYQVTPENRGKVGQIDMARKMGLQRPRQTVSVAMIGGGPGVEETLHWCLKQLVHIADELVIADCGLSDEAKRMLDVYRWQPLTVEGMKHGQRPYMNIRVVPGSDPKVNGFETPRNMALEACVMDWVLWLDFDEKLLQPNMLHKYLRPNGYAGYSIYQHHHAVDTTFDSDMPVRLFRNPKYTGSGMRFFGMIHEHPETALNEGPGRTIVIRDTCLSHVGYLIETGRRQRFERNYPMLQEDIKKYPERKLQKHFVMRDHMLLVGYELQMNGGMITKEMRDRCWEVIKLWRDNFKGQGHFTNVDPITYYSHAVGVLGIGFDAVVGIETDKVQARPNGAMSARFADADDFNAVVQSHAKAKSDRFRSPYHG